MKHIITTCVAVCVWTAAQAQLINQESLTGAALGAGAGAIIGNQYHGQSGEGAAIGAAAGFVMGQAVHQNRQYQNAQSYPYQAQSGAYYPYNNYPYYGSYGPAPAPYPPRRLNYALTGAALGAGAGAIIGNQHHGQSGEGALIGAAAGLLLGGLAERNTRQRERLAAEQWYAAQQPPPQVAAAPPATTTQQTAPPPASVAPPPAKSNLGEANRLFGR